MKKDKKTLDYDFTLVGLGAMFGVFGGILGNIIDRHFSKFGFSYEFIIAVVFFGALYYIDRSIRKMKG